MHRDDIARLRQFGGALNGAQRRGRGAWVGIVAVDGHMKLARRSGQGREKASMIQNFPVNRIPVYVNPGDIPERGKIFLLLPGSL